VVSSISADLLVYPPDFSTGGGIVIDGHHLGVSGTTAVSAHPDGQPIRAGAVPLVAASGTAAQAPATAKAEAPTLASASPPTPISSKAKPPQAATQARPGSSLRARA
jgi:hypothetical protein